MELESTRDYHIMIKLACEMEVKKGRGWLHETITFSCTRGNYIAVTENTPYSSGRGQYFD